MKFGAPLALILLCTYLSAQSLDNVFDDGGAALAANVVKINLAGTYRGQAMVSYERLFARQRLGLEAGLGVSLGFYRPDILSRYIYSFSYELEGVSGGNSAFLGARYYRDAVSDNTWVYALQASNRGFTFEDPDRDSYRVTDVGFGAGYIFAVGTRFTIDLLYLVSFRLYSEEARRDLEPRSDEPDMLSWAIPTLDVRLGYMF